MKFILVICIVNLFLWSCVKNNSLSTLILNKEKFECFELDTACKSEESCILFKDKKVDFGTVKKKNTSKILVYFPYANIGKSNLIVLNVDASCSCLSATYRKKPLKRGDAELIEVLVDIKNQQGVFNKTIFVKSNAVNNVELIRIKGVIE